MIPSLSRTLIRGSLLLFLISAIGLISLNHGLDPRNVSRIQAANIVIELTSNNANTLTFGVAADCVPTAMAPSDKCIANVLLQNTGDTPYTLNAPTIAVSGDLATCGGGGWFTAEFGPNQISYVPNSTVINVGDSHTFDVTSRLHLDTPNDCQGLTGLIVITLVATSIDEVEEPSTPEPTSTNTPTSTATATPTATGTPVSTATPISTSTPTPVSEVSGVRATPESTRTAVSTPRPVATFTSEVLPSRFPNTGQGGMAGTAAGVLKYLFLGIGLVAAGMLITALTLKTQNRSKS